MVEEAAPPLQEQDQVTQAKRTIKTWELEYLQSHGCRPDKAAMAAAPGDVRAAYKLYRRSRAHHHIPDGRTVGQQGKERNKEEEEGADTGTNDVSEAPTGGQGDGRVPGEQGKELRGSKGAGVWGSHLNKAASSRREQKQHQEQLSLYQKMARKMQEYGATTTTSTLRTSLTRTKTSAEPQGKHLTLKINQRKDLSPLTIQEKDMIPPSSQNQHVSPLTWQDQDVIPPISQEQFLTPPSTQEKLLTPLPFMPSTLPQTPTEPSTAPHSLHQDTQPEGIMSLDLASSLDLTPEEGDVPTSNFRVDRSRVQGPTQPVSALSALSALHTAPHQQGFTAVKKRACLNKGWVARCTKVDMQCEDPDTAPTPALTPALAPAPDAWKMKLTDKEWVQQDVEEEEGSTVPPSPESEGEDYPNVLLRPKSSRVRKGRGNPTGKGKDTPIGKGRGTPTGKGKSTPTGKAGRKRAPVKGLAPLTQEADGGVTPAEVEEGHGRGRATPLGRNALEEEDELPKPATRRSRRNQGRADYCFEDSEGETVGERDCRTEGEESQDWAASAEDEEQEEIVHVRKRKKVETLEELEESGEIQSVWPPPKKKRVGRKAAPRRSTQAKRAVSAAPIVKNTQPCTRGTGARKKTTRSGMGTATTAGSRVEKHTQGTCKEEAVSASMAQPPGGEYDEGLDIAVHGARSSVGGALPLEGPERLTKKMASGTANNNYIKINLKKKTYVRGKKTMTGGKYRRQEWKRKMQLKAGGAGSAGRDTGPKFRPNSRCYNCGKMGHWVLACPGKPGQTLLPLQQGDDGCPTFPSLEEVADMVRGPRATTGQSITRTYLPDHTGEAESPDSHLLADRVEIEPPDSHQLGDRVEIEPPGNHQLADMVEIEPPGNHQLPDTVETLGNLLLADTQEAESPGQDSGAKGSVGEGQAPAPTTAPLHSPQQPSATPAWGGLEDEDDHIFANIGEQVMEPLAAVRSEPRRVDPLYSLQDGKVPPAPPEVVAALQLFGHESFRAGQEEAVMRVLCGLSTLVVVATGWGKSLCYQLPAHLYAQGRGAITLCVSPLVSLMEDQVQGLPPALSGVCLHSQQTASQKAKALAALRSGKAQVLLLSPEAVVGGHLLTSVLREAPPVALACLDEAHCVSQWSHNFRPSYLQVCKVLQRQLGVTAILGLTATARHPAALSIARHLQVLDPDQGIIRGPSLPDNLLLSASRDREREGALVALLQGERFAHCSSIIVYCTRRYDCERVAALLRTRLQEGAAPPIPSRGISSMAEAYHAGLSAQRRRRVQQSFMSGKLRLVVATVAFGMGLDKADVRGVLHFNTPRNLESYVQEIGRAGRDGLPAHCHVFLDPDGQDTQEHKKHIYSNSLDRHTIRRLLAKVFQPCSCVRPEQRGLGQQQNQEGKENSSSQANQRPSTPPLNTEGAGDTAVKGGQELQGVQYQDGGVGDPYHVVVGPLGCPGHEVALPIAELVEELDLPEENLKTLLCYLEQHQGHLVSLGPHTYATCSVACYGGHRQLVEASRKCAALGAAVALHQDSLEGHNSITFQVVEVASRMGWDMRVVKRELKALEWAEGRRSGVMVEFRDLAFLVRAKGNLGEEELDQVLGALHHRATTQELNQLRQLAHTGRVLRAASHTTVLLCCDTVDLNRSQQLRADLRHYFSPGGLDLAAVPLDPPVPLRPEMESGVLGTVRALLGTHHDQRWTGRAVARVLHGLGSPNFPTEVWGRVRRFWRAHTNVDFNQIIRLANRQILRSR